MQEVLPFDSGLDIYLIQNELLLPDFNICSKWQAIGQPDRCYFWASALWPTLLSTLVSITFVASISCFRNCVMFDKQCNIWNQSDCLCFKFFFLDANAFVSDTTQAPKYLYHHNSSPKFGHRVLLQCRQSLDD